MRSSREDITAVAPIPDRAPQMNVLALVSGSIESPSPRFRVVQLVPHLESSGITVTIRPFIDNVTFRHLTDRGATPRAMLGVVHGAVRRVGDVVRARRADVILVERQAMFIGPPVIEMLSTEIGRCPLVLDLDDPMWMAAHPLWVGSESSMLDRFKAALRWPSKIGKLIDHASVVTCGNRIIADYVTARGSTAVLLPPAVETATFRPRQPPDTGRPLVVGWIGSPGTYAYLEPLLPTLAEVAREHPFRLRVVGSGRTPPPAVADMDLDWRDWSLAEECSDFTTLDIGLYPLPEGDCWAEGKAGLKSVEYLASGVPFIASPIGGAGELGIPGTTHLVAGSSEDWHELLRLMLEDPQLRARMATAGRHHALAFHSARSAANIMADALRTARRTADVGRGS